MLVLVRLSTRSCLLNANFKDEIEVIKIAKGDKRVPVYITVFNVQGRTVCDHFTR